MNENTHLGLGVMIQMLGGNEDSVKALTGALGKTIKELTLGTDDALHFVFEDGTKMRLFDEGQSCCETRYMRTDDRLGDFIGATLTGAVIKQAPNLDHEWCTHEVQFLEVQTSKGVLTMSSHNEHNGYYGGFCVRAASE